MSSDCRNVRPLYQRVLDALFQPSQSYEDARVPKLKGLLTVEDIQQLVAEAKELMMQESTLLYVPAPCRVVSDLHGQFPDLMRMWGWCGAPDGSIPWVFLGDYVDRSAFGLEVLMILYALKIKWPDKIILLRGNHEIANVNRFYGFKDELFRKWGARRGEVLLNVFNDSFDFMPLAAIAVPPGYEGEPESGALDVAFMPSRYLMVHGGIGRLETLAQISSVQRPVRTGTGDVGEHVMLELCWSDPAASDDYNGLLPNKRDNYSGGIVCYGADRVQDFCQRNRITAILRGHECIKEGLELAFGGQVVTFFSAVNYGGHGDNHGCILHLALTKDEGDRPSIEIQPIRLEAKQRRWSSYESDYDDDADDGDVTDLEPDQDLSVTRKSPDQGPVQRQICFQTAFRADSEEAACRHSLCPAGPEAITPMAWDKEDSGTALQRPEAALGSHGVPLDREAVPRIAGNVDLGSTTGNPELEAARHLNNLSLHPNAPEPTPLGQEIALLQSASMAAAQASGNETQQRILLQAMMQLPTFKYLVAQSLCDSLSGVETADDAVAVASVAPAGTVRTSAAFHLHDGSSSSVRSQEVVNTDDGHDTKGTCGVDDAMLMEEHADGAKERGNPASPSRPGVKVVVAFPWPAPDQACNKCPTPPRPRRDAGQFGELLS